LIQTQRHDETNLAVARKSRKCDLYLNAYPLTGVTEYSDAWSRRVSKQLAYTDDRHLPWVAVLHNTKRHKHNLYSTLTDRQFTRE
jgi:hypothetical protein